MCSSKRHPVTGDPRRERGNALVVGIVVVVALAVLATGFMQTVGRDQKLSAAVARKTRASYIAEAGISHAIVHLTGGGDGNVASQNAPFTFGGGEYWVHTVDNGDGSYTVTSCGRVGEQIRAFEVVLAPQSQKIFKKAMFGDLDLGASGNVFTDSYEADLGTYASQAVNVDPVTGLNYASMNGSLGSNANIIINGKVKVLGDATPGPGGSVIINGGSCYISGSTAPAPKPWPFPPLDYDPPIPSAGNFSQSTDYTFTTGQYRYTTLGVEADAEVHFQGDVEIWVDGNFSLSGQANFIVDPGSTVKLYHGGNQMSLTGGGVINETQLPSSFKVFTAATNVKLGGNSSFYGAIYAPHGEIDPGGTTDIFGSFVARQIEINGAANFHYDEALAKSPDVATRLIPVSWRRVSAGGTP